MRFRLTLLAMTAAVMLWSAIHPADRLTWWMEVAPVLIALPILIATYRRFPFSDFAYLCMFLQALILMIGAHYTYAEVPAFDWLRDTLQQSRNNYDKVGHFIQGFTPAVITREILWRNRVVQHQGWLAFFTLCVCLSISVVYEWLEWLAALLNQQAADSFLGTQGYAWDTQSDMLWCGIGATIMLLFFSKIHDRSIARRTKTGQNII